MTDAHEQHLNIHLLCHIPPHEPREEDPYYKVFNATKDRMKKMGLLRCAISGCTYPGPIELHHQLIEFSLQNGVDLAKFNEAYGLHLKDDEEFKAYIEGPGNLEPLCPIHHRGAIGIHSLPGPLWDALRVWRTDMPPPAEVVHSDPL